MESNVRHILVPWDFTPTSEFALQHANQFAKVMNLSISLLHIVEQHKEDPNCQGKLSALAEKNEKSTGIHTKALIQNGDVLKTISELASLPDTAAVIMKTDGVKGIQKYTGSRAIKIMRGSQAPFIVVQNTPKSENIKKIVYPIDFRRENKELISHITSLMKSYAQPKIYLLKAFTTDKRFLKNISNTVNFAKTLFEGKHVEFEVVSAKEGSSYASSVNEFANSVGADLIVIQLQRNLTLSKFIFGVKEQGIIANPYKIPVMVINPRETMVYAGFR